MRSTFRLMFYINRNKVKSDGTTAILCRISIDGRKSAVTTGIYCKPSDWDSNKGEIRMNKENNRLTAFRSRLEEAYGNLLKNQGVVTAELLKATVSNTVSIPEFLLQTGEAERERLRIRSVEINSTSTYRQSKTTQLNLRQFIESRGMRDIAFSDITEEFAESFKIFLKKELGHGNGHVNHCLCWLNRLIYIAVDREVLRANPIENPVVLGAKFETVDFRDIYSELSKLNDTVKELDSNFSHMRKSEIIESALRIHHRITVIHPFGDGNGRTSRAFLNLMFLRYGLIPTYTKLEVKEEYYTALESADKYADYTRVCF